MQLGNKNCKIIVHTQNGDVEYEDYNVFIDDMMKSNPKTASDIVFDNADFILNDDKIVELDKSLFRDSDEFDDDLTTINRHISYNIDFSTLECILKSQIECQINPLVSFVSIENECIFSVYDDRGCDIVFFSVDKYKEFYLKLEQYFLDYDREKMKETFESI